MPHTRQSDARRSPTSTIAFAASLALHTALFVTFLWIGRRDLPVNTAGIVVVFAAGEGAPSHQSHAPVQHERREASPESSPSPRTPTPDPTPLNVALPKLPIIALGDGARLPPAPQSAIERPASQAQSAGSHDQSSGAMHAADEPNRQSHPVESDAAPARPGASRGVAVSHAAAPTYPASAIRLRQEGVVEVEVRVRADGRVVEARLHRSSGYDALDAAALEAARAARFQPALRNGRPTEGRIVIPFHFQLQSAPRPD